MPDVSVKNRSKRTKSKRRKDKRKNRAASGSTERSGPTSSTDAQAASDPAAGAPKLDGAATDGSDPAKKSASGKKSRTSKQPPPESSEVSAPDPEPQAASASDTSANRKASAGRSKTRRKGKQTKKAKKAKKTESSSEPAAGATVGDLVAALGSDADAHGETDEGHSEQPAQAAESAAVDTAGDSVDETETGDSGGEGPQDVEAGEAASGDAGDSTAGGIELADTLPMAPDDDLSEVEGEASPRLMKIIESVLFASTKPLTVREIRKLLQEPSIRQIQLAIKGLIAQTADRGVVVGQVARGFRLSTHPDSSQWVQKLISGKPARLSRSQLETLAVIAYRQPMTKAEVDHIRGVDCSAVLRLLLERTLVKTVGRKEEPGRPILYGTTVEFLEFFNLRSLRDMPQLHEFRELNEESQATLRTKLGDEAQLAAEQEAMGQEVLGFEDSDTQKSGEDLQSNEAGSAAPQGRGGVANDDEQTSAEPSETADASSEGSTESTTGDQAPACGDDHVEHADAAGDFEPGDDPAPPGEGAEEPAQSPANKADGELEAGAGAGIGDSGQASPERSDDAGNERSEATTAATVDDEAAGDEPLPEDAKASAKPGAGSRRKAQKKTARRRGGTGAKGKGSRKKKKRPR